MELRSAKEMGSEALSRGNWAKYRSYFDKDKLKRVSLSFLGLVLGTVSTSTAFADTKFVRTMWNTNPDRNTVVGFTATAANPYIRIGETPDETKWRRVEITKSFNFGESSTRVVTQFVELDKLTPNSSYYFQACDDTGCGQRYWFQTMSSSPRDMTFISGGDSRTNRDIRQKGNRMVAKIRPAFVLFGGDLTDDNASYQMAEWLEDWELSYTEDKIDGKSFKYIPALVVNVGNHEDNRMTFVCTVFGAEKDGDGKCTNRDTYGAFNVNGSQMRLYNLNSQLRFFASEHSTQTNWMLKDLATEGLKVSWRIGGYHVPALPRTSHKDPVTPAMYQWGRHFYDYRMNVVFESDSHLLKVTAPVKNVETGGADYQEVAAGTVYLGEGAWGAPLRPADIEAPWLKDLYEGYNFQVLQFVGNRLHVRSILFDTNLDKISPVSRTARSLSALALPKGLPIRPIGKDEIYVLALDSNGRTKLDFLSVSLSMNQSLSIPEIRRGESRYFTVVVPEGVPQFKVKMTGGIGDGDLYLQYGAVPGSNSYQRKSAGKTNDEEIVIRSPKAGTYYLQVASFAEVKNATLNLSTRAQ